MRVFVRTVFSAAAALALFLPPAFSQAQWGSGVIKGRVTDAATGAGIAGVRMLAMSSGGGRAGVTDAGGYYTLSNLIPGLYRLQAYTDLEFPGIGYATQYYSQKYYFETADPIKAENGVETTGVDMQLDRGAVITGQLTDAHTGEVVVGLKIAAYTLGEKAAFWNNSDENGIFELQPLRDGYYRLLAYTQPYNYTNPEGKCFQQEWYLHSEFGSATVFQVAKGEVRTLSGPWELDYCKTPTPEPEPTPTPEPPPLQIYQVWPGYPSDPGDGIGQATVVIAPNDKVWLFDCGDRYWAGELDKDCPREVLYLLDSLGYSSIDYAVVSHYDADHCYGFITIANGTGDPGDPPLVRDGVGQIPVAYDRGGTTDVDGDPLSVFYTAGISQRKTPVLGTDIPLGSGAVLRWLAFGNPNYGAPGETNEVYVLDHAPLTTADGNIDENSKSIVVSLLYGGFDYYIGGDSTCSSLSSFVGVEEAVSEVYRTTFNRSFDIILLDHHGSSYHTPTYFLMRTLPEAAMVACWDNNYGHPTCATLDRVVQYTETGPGRQSVFQVDEGSSSYPCNAYALSANAPIRIFTDGYYYSIEPRSDLAPAYYTTASPLPISRYTSLDPITDTAWDNHPVDDIGIPTPTPAPTPPVERSVVINEVCWAGTQASYYDEWIEFYNRTDTAVDISSWSIISPRYSFNFSEAEGSLVIPAHGYWVFADKQIFSSGATVNITGSIALYNDNQGQFRLYNQPDGAGVLVDAVNPDGATVWCGGSSGGEADRRSMERRNWGLDGAVCANWCTYGGVPVVEDSSGYPVLGSPGYENSCFFTTPSPSPSPIASPTPTTTPIGFKTPSPSTTPTPLPPVVIVNEIAWSGTAAGGSYEWIELYNATGSTVDLTNWFLEIGGVSIDLTGSIDPMGYYLLERYQAAVSDIPGDMVYDFGSISNLGETVALLNTGITVDFIDCLSGWFAGSASPGYYSMERIYPGYSGSNPSNWQNNNGVQTNGHDADGNPLNATARAQNSAYLPTPPPTPRVITPTPTISPITPTPTVTPFGYKTPPPTPPPPAVVINEVAWAGTAASTSDEWMELYNNTGSAVSLAGWVLASTDGNPNISLAGSIGAHSYYLIERTDDNVISDIPGDLVVSFGTGLSNTGEHLQLKNGAAEVVDELDCSGGWWGGDNTTKATMERIDPEEYGNLSSNWSSWAGPSWNGRDANNNPVKGTARAQNSIYAPGSAFLRLDNGDYNGDGIADIAVFRPSSGLWVIRLLSSFHFGRPGDLPVSGDYDGDGTSDAAVYRPEKGLWLSASGLRLYLGRGGDVPVPRDYNGDGITDPAVFRPASALWVVDGQERFYYGAPGDLAVPADYLGTGAVPAVFREGSGLWAVRGGFKTWLGRSGDIPVPADYDGDGRADVAVYRPSSGLWAGEAGLSYFGAPGDLPLPADYNGDGTAQSAVYRPSKSLWAIEEGEGKTGAIIYFGTAEDIPATR
ncbi:MAG TPA: lamin tail domain-containing protein [bacterium]|nr:lamin tail domain-containing protein [bacterium]